MKDTGQFGGIPGEDIKATDAWGITTGNPSTKIAVIDGGVNGSHDDLSGKVSGDATYYWGHGTHVAGIASAKSNNQIGIAGVNWNAQIIAKDCADRFYSPEKGRLDDTKIHDGIISSVNEGAAVLNASFGSLDYKVLERAAFAYAYKMNRVSVVAMGNEYLAGNPVSYPAAYGQGIITVGATTNGGIRSSYSSTGSYVDVVAPGGTHLGSGYDEHDIYSCWHEAPYYTYLSGTSMATPHVSGLAGLLKGYRSDLYNDDIEQIIRISADDKGQPGWDEQYGSGRINSSRSLELLHHPYYLARASASGAYRAGNTDYYNMRFYETPGLAVGTYIVKRYEVRKDITLPREFWGTPFVWGRGLGSTGYSGEIRNFGMGFCATVPGSVTSTTATLLSFVYDVWTVDVAHVGWVPCAPEDVTFAYSVLGEPRLLASTLSGLRSAQEAAPYIRTTWTEPNVNEQRYKVERKDATYNQWFEKATLDSNYTSWTDTNFTGSETYTYRVKAYNVHQNSDYSNEKVIKARPNAPTNFQATKECIIWGWKGCEEYSNTVYLSWQPPGNQKLPINSYKVRIEEWYGPTHIRGPIYGLEDTLCLDPYTSYNIRVWAIDSENDDGYWAPRQVVTTGRDFCGGPEQKLVALVPKDFFLDQNYPNPFNLQTQIRYGLPQDARVKLVIYNILGEKVRVLVDEYQPAGERNVFWDGRNDRGETVASGIYLYQIQAGSFTKTAKMSLLK